MSAFVYRHKKRVNGAVIKCAVYRGRYRVDGMPRPVDVSLRTTDKQVAMARLNKLVADVQQEGEGLIPQRRMREAAQRSLELHVRDFVTDLEATGRDDEYVDHVDSRLKILFRDLGWTQIKDLSPDGFQQWRARRAPKLAAKTVNEYLNSLSVFSNWMVKNGRMAANPFHLVSRLQTAGQEKYVRRALSPEETGRLMAAAGEHRASYLMALRTGLRRAELNALTWGDVDIDSARPSLTVRAETAKNRRTATLAMHPEVVAELKAIRPATFAPGDLILPDGVPSMGAFKIDLARAGIPYKDQRGRVADFHALRKTLCTDLGRAGVSPWQAMRIMRHSDIKLTVKTYTDEGQLPLQEALGKLASLKAPSRGGASTGTPTGTPPGTLPDTPPVVPAGLSVSPAVSGNGGIGDAEDPHEQRSKSLSGTGSRGRSVNGELAERGGFEPPIPDLTSITV